MPHSFHVISYLQLSCLQTFTVLISDTQPDVEHVHENYQQKCLSLINETNPEEPISLKRKHLAERCEVNKQFIGQRKLYEKKKRLMNSRDEGK